MYGTGISREGSLLDVGVELGFIKKSGAWFTYEGEQLGQGRENVKQFLRETPELAIEINERIRSQLLGTQLPAGATVGTGEAAEESGIDPDDEPISAEGLSFWPAPPATWRPAPGCVPGPLRVPATSRAPNCEDVPVADP